MPALCAPRRSPSQHPGPQTPSPKGRKSRPGVTQRSTHHPRERKEEEVYMPFFVSGPFPWSHATHPTPDPGRLAQTASHLYKTRVPRGVHGRRYPCLNFPGPVRHIGVRSKPCQHRVKYHGHSVHVYLFGQILMAWGGGGCQKQEVIVRRVGCLWCKHGSSPCCVLGGSSS